VRNNFRCKDGRWIVGVHHPEQKYWPVFCEATGQEALMDDPRFAEYEGRISNGKELIAIFDAVFASKAGDEWIETLNGRGLMFSPVQTLEEVIADPQAIENAYVVEFDHPEYGRKMIPGYPAYFSENSTGTRDVAPKLGEHTDLVLSGMGFTDQDIESLRKDRVIR
jgi:crotonobetainyl-CoA:carnitine CoA-transferase CaiB-like acyl-CoA transferase